MRLRAGVVCAAGVLVAVVGLAACGDGGGSDDNASTKVVTDSGVIIAGSEVVLTPKRPADADALQRSKEILESRLRMVGVETFTVDVRDGNVVVAIAAGEPEMTPGLGIVEQRGQVLFRPVLEALPPDTGGSGPPTSPPEEDDPKATVVLPAATEDVRYRLGPAGLTATDLASAEAKREEVTGTWVIDFKLTPAGTTAFNDVAAATGRGNKLAIDVDGKIVSAPTLNETTFQGSGRIAANFTQREAKDLAIVLTAGVLPVDFDAQPVQPFAGRS